MVAARVFRTILLQPAAVACHEVTSLSALLQGFRGGDTGTCSLPRPRDGHGRREPTCQSPPDHGDLQQHR